MSPVCAGRRCFGTTGMTGLLWTGLATGLLWAAVPAAGGGSPPSTVITNRFIRAKVHLPDATAGFYRGTRFDWAGVIEGLEYAGHAYFPAWFQRTDPQVRDFAYQGPHIVASPCTAVTGPAEEFTLPLGFEEAGAGGTFIKIGVGVLRKPDPGRYDPYRLYEIVNGGKWTVTRMPHAVEFRHELADAATGYACDYFKTAALTENKPALVLDHRLRNTGKQPIRTRVYNHNFLYLDRQPPGPDVTIALPFKILSGGPPEPGAAEIRDNQIVFSKVLSGEDRVYLTILGYGAEARDYDFRIEHRQLGAGMRVTGDRPLARVALWAIRAPLSLEPFIDVNITPGAEFTWSIRYEFYTLPKDGG
jgi:hypothetical protein